LTENKVKQLSGKPGRPKGVTVIGVKREDPKGIEIYPQPKEVQIKDKNSENEPQHVEIGLGEDENGQG
jgi:hypothetical protein